MLPGESEETNDAENRLVERGTSEQEGLHENGALCHFIVFCLDMEYQSAELNT